MVDQPGFLSRKSVNILTNRPGTTLVLVLLTTAVVSSFIPWLEVERGNEGMYDKSMPAFREWRNFVNTFGDDEFVLLAIKPRDDFATPTMLNALRTTTEELGQLESVLSVVSVTNLRVPQAREGVFGIFTFPREREGRLSLNRTSLEELREVRPLLDLLISRDLKTAGLILFIEEKARFQRDLDHLLERIRAICRSHFPKDTECRIVGMPVMRAAMHGYAMQVAFGFGILGALVGIVVAVYIFKSLRVTVVALTISGISVLWTLGIMAMMQTKLNTVTSVAFGLIIVIAMANIIHIVTKFNERYRVVGDRAEALRQALLIVAGPCVMCALTTSAGFASLTLSPVPIVSQAGLVMSVGVLTAVGLSLSICSFMLRKMKPLTSRAYEMISTDMVTRLYSALEHLIFSRHRICLIVGIAIIGAMLAVIPWIGSDTYFMALIRGSSKEAEAFRFVDQHLAPFRRLSIVIRGEAGMLKTPEFWKKVSKIEERLERVPGVERTESLLPFLGGLYKGLAGHSADEGGIFSDSRIIPQLLALLSLGAKGNRFVRQYVSSDYSTLHLPVRVRHGESGNLSRLMERLKRIVTRELKGVAHVYVTGHLALAEYQARTLVRSQVVSLGVAILVITALIAFQLHSLVMGLLSLVPNLFPLLMIFGTMAAFGIPLSSITIFSVVFSYGLSVDDTIHYLTQLRRELKSERFTSTLGASLQRAYRVTARALIATSAVFFFAFLTLLLSPFDPTVHLGLLCALAVVAALFGDLVFLPSIILSSAGLRKLLTKAEGQG